MKLFLLCILVLAAVTHGQYTEEDAVLVLKKDTFDLAVREFPNLLVEFCKLCTWHGLEFILTIQNVIGLHSRRINVDSACLLIFLRCQQNKSVCLNIQYSI